MGSNNRRGIENSLLVIDCLPTLLYLSPRVKSLLEARLNEEKEAGREFQSYLPRIDNESKKKNISYTWHMGLDTQLLHFTSLHLYACNSLLLDSACLPASLSIASIRRNRQEASFHFCIRNRHGSGSSRRVRYVVDERWSQLVK